MPNPILNSNRRFLLEPLINEIVEIIDALGLTVVALASITTNGLIPKPSERPNREKVEG
jgi:hypothetical protein